MARTLQAQPNQFTSCVHQFTNVPTDYVFFAKDGIALYFFASGRLAERRHAVCHRPHARQLHAILQALDAQVHLSSSSYFFHSNSCSVMFTFLYNLRCA